MNILYSIQATGNGHISRAIQLYPHLQKIGNVDFVLSGDNFGLDVPLPIKFRSKGLSLYYNETGGINYYKVWQAFNYRQLTKDINALPVKDYDIVISDFEFIVARACHKNKIPFIHMGHQASFASSKVPRPQHKSWIGECVLNNFCPSKHNIGFHFERYDNFIFPPIIKKEILEATPIDNGHITVYLATYEPKFLHTLMSNLSPIAFHVFTKNVQSPVVDNNITYQPVSQEIFNSSLISCSGLITSGGFETPSEALYLNKKVIVIPIQGQYEQHCNAAALKKRGILVLNSIKNLNAALINDWLSKEAPHIQIEANNPDETFSYLINSYLQ